MDEFGRVEVAIVEIERFEVEVLLVFDDVFKRDSIEGIGDDEAIFLVLFCLVFMVNSAVVAEGRRMGVVINDESFDYFSFCEEAVVEIHLCLVYSSEPLELSFFEEPIASRPLILENSSKPVYSKCIIFARMSWLVFIALDEADKVLTLIDGNIRNRVSILCTALMVLDYIVQKFIRLYENVHIYLLKDNLKLAAVCSTVAFLLRKRPNLGNLQHIGVLTFFDFALRG